MPDLEWLTPLQWEKCNILHGWGTIYLYQDLKNKLPTEVTITDIANFEDKFTQTTLKLTLTKWN